MKWLAELPSTNTRIAVTLLIYVGTATRYLVWGVPPGGDSAWIAWLAFTGLMAGADIAQFYVKRESFRPEAHRDAIVRESVSPPPSPPGVRDEPRPVDTYPAIGGSMVVQPGVVERKMLRDGAVPEDAELRRTGTEADD